MNDNSAVVICDDEVTYACHLMEYLEGSGRIPCAIVAYTDADRMLERQDPENTLLLVIAETEYSDLVAARHYKEILVLNESGRLMEQGIRNVSKYQAIDNIAAIIVSVCGQYEIEGPQTIRHSSPMKIAGIYSPLTRCLQTTFALTFGMLLSEQHRVLYLNFGNWPVLSELVTPVPEGTVADLLYFNDCAREKVSAHMNRIKTTIGGLDMIMPFRDFSQLQKITGEQWQSLFGTIGEVSEYEYLILDLSESVQDLWEILKNCSEVDTICRDDRISGLRMKLYDDMLREHNAQEIAARTRYWQFPVFAELPASLEDLTRGDFADYVRSRLQNGHRDSRT